MNILIASMETGFQVTISKSDVQMTSNPCSLVKIRLIMELNLSQAVVVQFFAGKKGKSSELDMQTTGESPRDPLSQRAANVKLEFFQLNVSIYTKIYHKIYCCPNGQLIFWILTF